VTGGKVAADHSAEIAEILPIAMVRLDAKGNVLFLNRAAHELLASMKVDPATLPEVLPQRYRSLVRQALTTREIVERDWIQAGRSFHLICRSSLDGESAYLFVVEMTAQERAKAQVIQNEKMASLGLLVAGVAHEVNTPLGSIHSNNDTISRAIDKIKGLLEEKGSLDAPEKRGTMTKMAGIVQEVCRNTSAATDRLMNIVGSLKNFARLDEADLKDADIHEGLESTLTIVQHQFKNRIKVEKQYGKIPRVRCYPNRLNQVFMNLLVNAAQAIPERGTITIKTSARANVVRIAISDTGTGIPAENIPKIFDPGFTTKGVGVGTGLGLGICYQIIQDHRGKIHVESGDGGTTFTIELPLAPQNQKKVKSGE
jgi:signal transduction histidine kinase